MQGPHNTGTLRQLHAPRAIVRIRFSHRRHKSSERRRGQTRARARRLNPQGPQPRRTVTMRKRVIGWCSPGRMLPSASRDSFLVAARRTVRASRSWRAPHRRCSASCGFCGPLQQLEYRTVLIYCMVRIRGVKMCGVFEIVFFCSCFDFAPYCCVDGLARWADFKLVFTSLLLFGEACRDVLGVHAYDS